MVCANYFSEIQLTRDAKIYLLKCVSTGELDTEILKILTKDAPKITDVQATEILINHFDTDICKERLKRATCPYNTLTM